MWAATTNLWHKVVVVTAFLMLHVRWRADAIFALSPSDPTVYLNKTLVLTCTLEPPTNYSSRDLTFKGPKGIDLTDVRIITPLIAELHLLGEAKLNRAMISCYKGKTKLIGMQFVTVHMPLTSPVITDCIVENSTMRCSWSPTPDNQEIMFKKSIVHDLKWKLENYPGDNWTGCPEISSDTPRVCIWPQSVFQPDGVYNIRIHARYKVHVENTSDTANFTIDSATIVKLGKIPSLFVRNLSPTSVNLAWPAAEINNGAIYWMNITHPIKIKREELLIATNNNITLDNLLPYQQYNISLEAKTTNYGFWSVPFLLTFRTMSDVPARHPEVSPGGYVVKERSDSPCRSVTVYWKPLLKREQNGPEFQYKVNTAFTGSCYEKCMNPSVISKNRVTFGLSSNCIVDVTVLAANANGTASTPSKPITIDVVKSNEIQGPSNFTVIAGPNDTTVTLRWNEDVKNSTTGYTVYWCNTLSSACKDDLQWRAVGNYINELPLTLPKEFDKYQFGIAREEGTLSSRMVLNECVYQAGETSPPPDKFIIDKSKKPVNGGLYLAWSAPECKIHRGYVYGFLLTYCESKGEPINCSDGKRRTQTLIGRETSILLQGLKENADYCVTVASITAKAPSLASQSKCGFVSGAWWTTSRIIGIAIGGAVALAFIIFGIVKFGRKCHKFYNKFQQGLDVVLPNTGYLSQFSGSGSSSRGLIDQNNSFIYNIEDYSSPGLGKQHSQESAADSGRGSMTHDHSRPPLHHSMSDESEVFWGNGSATRSRQYSEPMSSYARVLHTDGSDGQSTSMVNLDMTTSSPKQKHSPSSRKSLTESFTQSAIEVPHTYNTSSPSSIPSYVMVGENSHSEVGNNLNEHQVSNDNIRHEENPFIDYINPENGKDFMKPSNAIKQVPCVVDNQRFSDDYVTPAEATNRGLVTTNEPPQMLNPKTEDTSFGIIALGRPSAFDSTKHGNPQQDSAAPEIVNQGNSLDYVTVPEAANQGASLDYVTVPEAANQGASLRYVPPVEAANQGASLGYVPSPDAANHGNSFGYVPGPPPPNRGAQFGYVTAAEAANQGAPLRDIISTKASNRDESGDGDCDSNRNNIKGSGSFADSSNINSLLDGEALDEDDETSSLLPSDGGRPVLNKSGYVVINT